jgi:hypothetical protein
MKDRANASALNQALDPMTSSGFSVNYHVELHDAARHGSALRWANHTP